MSTFFQDYKFYDILEVNALNAAILMRALKMDYVIELHGTLLISRAY